MLHNIKQRNFERIYRRLNSGLDNLTENIGNHYTPDVSLPICESRYFTGKKSSTHEWLVKVKEERNDERKIKELKNQSKYNIKQYLYTDKSDYYKFLEKQDRIVFNSYKFLQEEEELKLKEEIKKQKALMIDTRKDSEKLVQERRVIQQQISESKYKQLTTERLRLESKQKAKQKAEEKAYIDSLKPLETYEINGIKYFKARKPK